MQVGVGAHYPRKDSPCISVNMKTWHKIAIGASAVSLCLSVLHEELAEKNQQHKADALRQAADRWHACATNADDTLYKASLAKVNCNPAECAGFAMELMKQASEAGERCNADYEKRRRQIISKYGQK